MSTVRAAAGFVLLTTALAAGARADSLTVGSSDAPWTYYLTGNDFSGLRSNLSAPSPAPTPTLNATFSASNASTLAPAPLAWTVADPTANTFNAATALAAPPSPSPSSSTGGAYDAFINFGTGNLPELSQLTVGSAQPWYDSPSVTKLFNGQAPNAAQQAQFTTDVLNDVKQTFALAGLSPKLTIDPTATANHTISVVSGVSYGPNAEAIGITDVGRNGFGFIDKLSYANTVTDLEWAVAHNVAHELMHAFGVAIHPDQTGTYVDAATATWSVLTDPNSTFSPAAASLIQATNFGAANASGALGTELMVDGDQEILAAPVPEPAAVAAWSLVVAVACLRARRRPGRPA